MVRKHLAYLNSVYKFNVENANNVLVFQYKSLLIMHLNKIHQTTFVLCDMHTVY